jgi:predicted 2-oxoglutarate/Fe(II)-dependent dioxygenase YbiX
MQVVDYVKTYNLIPKGICEDIIEQYEIDPQWQQHTWYNPSEDSKSSQHNKELDVLFNKKIDVLEQFLSQALLKYYDDLKLKDLVSYHSNIRLNKYKTGTIMSEHFDLIRRNKQDGIPVLTFLGLLNDDFEGGQFVLRDEVIQFKQGDIMIFPSTFLYPHKVKEVTQGTRYSFVSWAY